MCEDLGFAGAGIAPATASAHGEAFRRWLLAGRHGSMDYLADNVEKRLDPSRLMAGAASIIMVADQYAPRGQQDPEVPGQGRIARYARGRDYHKVMKKRLHALCDRMRERFPEHRFRAFVDTAPVLEREHAAAAGLGWIGKHTLLIHPRRGSYLLLGGVLTTLALDPSGEQVPDHCGTCTRCIDACPTRAITPYSVDGSKCIAYLTIERQGVVDASFHSAIGDWLYGCDICQEVCPHNSPRTGAMPGIVDDYSPRRQGFDLLSVLGWDENQRRRAMGGSPMTWASLEMLKRNAVIVAGNALRRSHNAELAARLSALASDPAQSELVRATAAAVLSAADASGRAV